MLSPIPCLGACAADVRAERCLRSSAQEELGQFMELRGCVLVYSMKERGGSCIDGRVWMLYTCCNVECR